MLDQRRRRWADVVQMLYKCFVFADIYMMARHPLVTRTSHTLIITYNPRIINLLYPVYPLIATAANLALL